jgi:Ribbon-helix-helix protein, copG family
MSKERINISATERQKRQVEKRCQEENIPMAEIIRRALDAYLAWDDPIYTPCPSPTKGRPRKPPSFMRGLSGPFSVIRHTTQAWSPATQGRERERVRWGAPE